MVDAIVQLENELNSFDSFERSEALCSLSIRAEMGEINLARTSHECNLHLPTFFSYNDPGWSPSRIAWEAAKKGLLIAGIADSDVLDGMEEFLAAGELINLRTTAALETSVFVRDYFDKIIHSPNEPGIARFIAAGCFRQPSPGSPAHDTLRMIREVAEHKNVRAMERMNAYLDKVQLDYEADVIPVTPSGNATEMHLAAAYDAKARQVFADSSKLNAFWSTKLGVSPDHCAVLINDPPALRAVIRGKLMSFGGTCHVSMPVGSLPTLEQLIETTLSMQAIPTAVWMGGASQAESDIQEMLELLAAKGTAAVVVMLDRNWNEQKSANLQKLIVAARQIGFPICVGSDMQLSSDYTSAPELAAFVEDFVDGAYFFWGHTVLARNMEMGFASEWANHHFGNDRLARNRFYTSIGRIVSPKEAKLLVGSNLRIGSPTEVLRALQR